MQPDYGELQVYKVVRAVDFWYLHECMSDDKSGFSGHRTVILDAMLKKQLYGVRVIESDAMAERHADSTDPLFNVGADAADGRRSRCALPCFCIVHPRPATCPLMWVHSSARRMGIGRAMAEQLKIRVAEEVLPESEAFWRACGVLMHGSSKQQQQLCAEDRHGARCGSDDGEDEGQSDDDSDDDGDDEDDEDYDACKCEHAPAASDAEVGSDTDEDEDEEDEEEEDEYEYTDDEGESEDDEVAVVPTREPKRRRV